MSPWQDSYHAAELKIHIQLLAIATQTLYIQDPHLQLAIAQIISLYNITYYLDVHKPSILSALSISPNSAHST